MSRIKIWSYNPGSRSARVLSQTLTERLGVHIRTLAAPERSKYRSRGSDVVINFGNSKGTERFNTPVHFLNDPASIGTWSNKLSGYAAVEERAPDMALPYTVDAAQANEWLANGFVVVCRHKLTGHSAAGVEIIEPARDARVPDAPVYTRYMPKSQEFRVHFFKQDAGFEFMWQEKRRKRDVEDDKINWQIRNLEGGFIYATQDMNLPKNAQKRDIEDTIAHVCNDLDYGGIDLVYTTDKAGDRAHQHIILEVNTACGMQAPSVIEFYTNNFERRLRREL